MGRPLYVVAEEGEDGHQMLVHKFVESSESLLMRPEDEMYERELQNIINSAPFEDNKYANSSRFMESEMALIAAQ
jgi:hypothetical protein